MTTVINISEVSKHFLKDERWIIALEQLSLSVEEETFVVLLGRSGCGKSTLLNMVAGLNTPTSGQICYRDQPFSHPLPQLGYLTQRDTLMPWRNLRDNIAMPLEFNGVGKRTTAPRRRVHQAGQHRGFRASLSSRAFGWHDAPRQSGSHAVHRPGNSGSRAHPSRGGARLPAFGQPPVTLCGTRIGDSHSYPSLAATVARSSHAHVAR